MSEIFENCRKNKKLQANNCIAALKKFVQSKTDCYFFADHIDRTKRVKLWLAGLEFHQIRNKEKPIGKEGIRH